MGFFSSFFKKIKKTIKKPLSKITKGIARGVAKVGKAVMKGVAKLNSKFGPLGMIAMSIAMPYAMNGLSSWIGTVGQGTVHGGFNSGLLAKDGFLGAIGKIGNTIRTGYQASTGKIASGWKSITSSISEGFSTLSKGTGNLWTNISEGAKNLFSSSKDISKSFSSKFRAIKSGSVDVTGQIARGPASWNNQFINQTMTNVQAEAALKGGLIQGDQLVGQSLSKYGISEADSFITQTIDKAMESQVNGLQGNTKRYFNDLVAHQKSKGIHVNTQETLNSVLNNKGTTKSFLHDFSTEPMYSTNLSKTGDYTLGTARDRAAGTYNFTGGDTYNNSLGNKYINKKTVSNIKKAAFSLGDSLLASNYETPDVMYEVPVQKDMTMNTATSGSTGTNLTGVHGTNAFNAVFGNAAWEKLKNNYKYMNI